MPLGSAAPRSPASSDLGTEPFPGGVPGWHDAFDGAPMAMAVTTLDGRLLTANRAYHELFGCREEDLGGRHLLGSAHPDDRIAAGDLIRACATGTPGPAAAETRYRAGDGRRVWVALHISAVRGEGGVPVRIVAQLEDITGRKEAEAEMLRYTAELRARMRRVQPAGAERAAGGPLSPEAADRFSGLLSAAREHLGMDVTWLSEFTEDEQVFRALDGDAGSFGLEQDAGLDLAGSFCLRVLDGRLPAVIPDTAREAGTRHLEVTAAAGIVAYAGAPVELADGTVYGMLCAASHDARTDLDQRDAGVLRVLATVIADHLDRERAEAQRRRADAELAGMGALLAALEARDHYTGEHSQAVVRLAGAIARELGLPAATVTEVEQVALLHDVGKIGIPDGVLHKRGPLNEVEWELMRQHSPLGGRIVGSIPSLAHLAPAVRAEHERWDGGGYPDGLAGDAIPIAARVILAADAFHAMTSDRPYRRAMETEAALGEVERCAGSQFDPAVAAALVAAAR